MTPTIKETEAHQRWCPFARITTTNRMGRCTANSAAGWNRRNENDERAWQAAGVTCIGGDCMAWVSDGNRPGCGRCGLVR